LQSAVPGQGCGVVALSWLPALDECGPVIYDVYRSADDPFFLPGPPTLIGSTSNTAFEDSGLPTFTDFWYIVRARDSAWNEAGPDQTFAVQSSAIDLVVKGGSFELVDEGWILDPDSTATKGDWELGNPYPALPYQSDDCADGARCWITGIQPTTIGGQANDVDGGSTTLVSPFILPPEQFPLLSPAFEYSYWVAGHPSTRVIEESRPGWGPIQQPTQFEPVTELAPLQTPTWRTKRHPVEIAPMLGIQIRFTASAFSLTSPDEAGIDNWKLIDVGRECIGCSPPTQSLTQIRASRAGQDVVLDWSQSPTSGARFGIYVATTPTFQNAVRVGSTGQLAFTHEGAAYAPQDLYYLVSAFDRCGNESPLH
jgi:hypothetical protein